MSNQVTVIQEEFYKSIKPRFISQTDKETFTREINFAIQALKKNQYMQGCDANSVLDAVLNVSQTGLSLNPVLNYAYLVPHKGKCVLYPGYQGLVKLATDTGSVTSIEVNLIYEGDEVVLDLASDKKIEKHIPYLLKGNPKGKIRGGYSLANLPDGSKHVEIMSLQDIHDVREYSESYKNDVKKGTKNSPWIHSESEMCRKSILKRHFKYIPKSDKNEKLIKAIELDNKDYDFPITMNQGNYIENLLITSSVDEKTQNDIYNNLSDMTQKRAKECIDYLQENQKDAITQGTNYSQTDIQNKLADKMADPKA